MQISNKREPMCGIKKRLRFFSCLGVSQIINVLANDECMFLTYEKALYTVIENEKETGRFKRTSFMVL
jgi:hypothetical protein